LSCHPNRVPPCLGKASIASMIHGFKSARGAQSLAEPSRASWPKPSRRPSRRCRRNATMIDAAAPFAQARPAAIGSTLLRSHGIIRPARKNRPAGRLASRVTNHLTSPSTKPKTAIHCRLPLGDPYQPPSVMLESLRLSESDRGLGCRLSDSVRLTPPVPIFRGRAAADPDPG